MSRLYGEARIGTSGISIVASLEPMWGSVLCQRGLVVYGGFVFFLLNWQSTELLSAGLKCAERLLGMKGLLGLL